MDFRQSKLDDRGQWKLERLKYDMVQWLVDRLIEQLMDFGKGELCGKGQRELKRSKDDVEVTCQGSDMGYDDM